MQQRMKNARIGSGNRQLGAQPKFGSKEDVSAIPGSPGKMSLQTPIKPQKRVVASDFMGGKDEGKEKADRAKSLMATGYKKPKYRASEQDKRMYNLPNNVDI